jgi:hypothetical protein
MNSRQDLMTERFLWNMRRIRGLVTLTSGVDAIRPSELFRSEGPRADILRAIVVFLHATFEDVLRTQARKYNKKLTVSVSSGADIDRILRTIDLNPTPFKPLYPPLSQMAKRRNRIVHEADFSQKTAIASEAWTIADDWQLIMWLLAVPAFHSLLCTSIDPENQVAREKYWKLRKAMDGFVNFGKQLVTFSQTTQEINLQLELSRLLATLKKVSDILEASPNVIISDNPQ